VTVKSLKKNLSLDVYDRKECRPPWATIFLGVYANRRAEKQRVGIARVLVDAQGCQVHRLLVFCACVSKSAMVGVISHFLLAAIEALPKNLQFALPN